MKFDAHIVNTRTCGKCLLFVHFIIIRSEEYGWRVMSVSNFQTWKNGGQNMFIEKSHDRGQLNVEICHRAKFHEIRSARFFGKRIEENEEEKTQSENHIFNGLVRFQY